MNINTRDLSFVNFNGHAMQYIKYNNLLVWEAWKKLIASGIPPLTLNKCKGSDLIDYKIYGESVQQNENLFNDTLTVGYISSTGTEYSSVGNIKNTKIISITENVELSFNTNIPTSKITFCYYENDTFVRRVETITKEHKLTTSLQDNENGIRFYITSTDTNISPSNITNIQVKQLTPTPEAPIEIESVGYRTNNLLPINGNVTLTYQGVTITIENDIITLNGTSTTNFQFGVYIENGKLKVLNGVVNINNNVPSLISKLEAGTYTQTLKYLSGKVSGSGSKYIGLYTYKNGVKSVDTRKNFGTKDDKYTFTIDEDKEVQFFVVQIGAINAELTFDNYKFKYMLSKGDEEKEYEPYGYRIPVKVSGKNLFNKETATLGNNLNASTGTLYGSTARCVSDYIEVDTTKEYTFVYNRKFTLSRYICCYDKDKKFLSESANLYKISSGNWFTVTTISFISSEVKYIRANCYWNEDGTESEIDDFIIYEGSGDNRYEPHIEPVTTNIYLDEPLRKIGDYADYIDFENKKLIRNVHVDKISEISNVRYYEPSAAYPYGFFAAYTQNTKRNGLEVLSNIYTNDRNGFKKDKNIMGNATGNNIYIIDKDYTDPVILINTLKDNEIYYVLATPDPQQIELPNIPTLKGTTILSVDSKVNSSYMEVVYKGMGDLELLDSENNLILNDILSTDTETQLNITNTEIVEILDEIIGG